MNTAQRNLHDRKLQIHIVLKMLSLLFAAALLSVQAASAQVTITSTADIQTSAQGGYVQVNWTALENWTANVDADWLTFPTASGGPGKWGRTLSWAANPTTRIRIGHVTIGAAVVTVTQAGGDTDWLEAKSPQYSIFYTEQYSQDLPKAQVWLEFGFAMMQSRYKLTSLPQGMRLFLHPKPTTNVSTGNAYTNNSTGQPPEIHYLTPSSYFWLNAGMGTLGNEKNSDDYHAYIIVHEFTHVVQAAIRPRFDYPKWVHEGMATYEGLFSSTEFNRNHAPDWLARWVKSRADTITCCQSLAGDGLAISEEYNSAGFFWYFLANTYGSDVNRQVYTAPTTDIVEAVKTATSGTLPSDLFSQLLTFFRSSTSAVKTVEIITGPTSLDVTARSGSKPVTVWSWGKFTVSLDVGWLSFDLAGEDLGTYGRSLNWEANPYCSPRTGVLSIGDATVTVNQAAATTGCIPKPEGDQLPRRFD